MVSLLASSVCEKRWDIKAKWLHDKGVLSVRVLEKSGSIAGEMQQFLDFLINQAMVSL